MALPLENGIVITPVYEEMREAWEDWRLLSLLKASGKTELLDSLLKEFGDSFDPPNMETSKPYKCDFQALHAAAGNGGMIVFNLGFEPLVLPNGETVAPARAYPE